MSTESVGAASTTATRAPVNAKPFEVPGDQGPATRPQPTAEASGPQKSSFQNLEQWNKSPMRAKADAAMKSALMGGPDLSPQDKELLRRNIMVMTQGGDFDEAKVAEGVKTLLTAMRDPKKAEAIRTDLWTQQAQAFGGMYVPDQYKQAVAGRLRGETSAPGPDTQDAVSETDSEEPTIDANGNVVVPTEDSEAPVETTSAETEEVTPTPATASKSSVQQLIAAEFAKLTQGKPTMPLSAMAPILEKLGIGQNALPQIAKILEQRKIDPKAINAEQYGQTRLDVTTAAAMRLAQAADPTASKDKLEAMVKQRLPEAIQKTTI